MPFFPEYKPVIIRSYGKCKVRYYNMESDKILEKEITEKEYNLIKEAILDEDNWDYWIRLKNGEEILISKEEYERLKVEL